MFVVKTNCNGTMVATKLTTMRYKMQTKKGEKTINEMKIMRKTGKPRVNSGRQASRRQEPGWHVESH